MILIATIDAWPCTLSYLGYAERCSLNKATVYRNIKKLLELGFIRRIPIGNQEFLTVTKYSSDFLTASRKTVCTMPTVNSELYARHDQTVGIMHTKPYANRPERETPRETIEKEKFETYVSSENGNGYENRDPEELAREALEAELARKKISEMIKTGTFGPMTIKPTAPKTPLEFENEAKRQLSQVLPSPSTDYGGKSNYSPIDEEDPF